MKVLIIPEDFTKDQYLLKPIITAMLNSAGLKNTRVAVCQNPRLCGISQALKWERIEGILKIHPMVDLFILCVDRDGKAGRRQVLDALEETASAHFPNQTLLAENAWQELEVWALAGAKDWPADWLWAEIQEELHPKETYYLPYVKSKKLDQGPDEGRRILAEQAASRYVRLRQLCPQDLGNLEKKVINLFSNNKR